jgi:uncharacterized protein involved in tellurium resistance
MAEEVKLKRKITLRRKQEEAAFTFSGKLKVNLYWTSNTDLDLCLFFRKKDGEVGGVFSNEYRQKKSDLGSLDKFPYILHLGDIKEPAPGCKGIEQINIAKLDDIDEAFICIVNYDAAIEGEDVTYAERGGRIEVKSDSGDYLEVLADSSDEGHVYCVCSIKNKGGEFALKNESRVMSLGKAFDEIPGFSLICED